MQPYKDCDPQSIAQFLIKMSAENNLCIGSDFTKNGNCFGCCGRIYFTCAT